MTWIFLRRLCSVRTWVLSSSSLEVERDLDVGRLGIWGSSLTLRHELIGRRCWLLDVPPSGAPSTQGVNARAESDSGSIACLPLWNTVSTMVSNHCLAAVSEGTKATGSTNLETVAAGLRSAREDWRLSQARHAEYGELGFPSRHAIVRIIDMLSAA